MGLNAYDDASAARIDRAVLRVEEMIPPEQGGGLSGPLSLTIGRWMRVTGCTKSTGFAEGQFTSGPPDFTLDTSLTVKLYLEIDGWWQVGDDVAVMPIASPDLHWVVVAGRYGIKRWTPPTSTELASVQDNPAADSYCTQNITVP